MVSVRAFHGDPIVGRSLVWIGESDMPNQGIGVANHWFIEDRVALGLAANWTSYDTSRSRSSSHDRTWAYDLETRLRYYAVEIDSAAAFLDFFGGYTRGDRRIPPEGTRTNYTFGGGGGIDIPLFSGISLLTGTEFHHFSNARGRNASDNPSQNELLFWGGVGVRW